MSRRIGIDVGGTNTDAAVVEMGGDRPVVVAAHKTPTTLDVLSGVTAALAEVPTDGVEVVVIGTTQFTNAVVQRRSLNKVGFIRLGYPAGTSLRPLVGWPTDLASVIDGGHHLVTGGLDYDGRDFMPLDEAAVTEAARRFADRGIDAIVITGSFSPIDARQEERAAELVLAAHPSARLTLSHRLGRLGLLERENAAALNASLVELAATVVSAFSAVVRAAGLGGNTRLFLSQNDGTLLSLDDAAAYPVLTFASGPTNSMRGAALLGGVSDGIVVDVGGTTADFGALVTGYPRQANAAVDVGGVRTLFRLPDLESIGLGGGSRLRKGASGITIGPDSVGQALLTEALAFGGLEATLTDAALASGRLTIPDIPPPALPPDLDPDAILTVAARMIGDGADRMKLASGNVPLVAVGGGAYAVPDVLDGFDPIVRPEHASVANAVGAALAEVSGEVDQVFHDLGRDGAIEAATALAIERVEAAGAARGSAEVTDVEDLPLAYVPGDARRVRVRVIGRLA